LFFSRSILQFLLFRLKTRTSADKRNYASHGYNWKQFPVSDGSWTPLEDEVVVEVVNDMEHGGADMVRTALGHETAGEGDNPIARPNSGWRP
jgi:hypothetical protein